ncbi:hypothetical protein F442_17474 [Phytophthora nicotianae P10297]|uniref:Peptidase A2 domain-containing protein n=1 Tax=Phytophthora nicotianae P10297 TaxID=1317064 RepID=W2YGQ9_PHYNI|nr:hypothetical protein F442_17474 [Phytophthora nicotianae P10297]
MTCLNDDEFVFPDRQDIERSEPQAPLEPENPEEFELRSGERYGWWVNHDPDEDWGKVATVHGAVNDFRTPVLLDTGATVSMMSLNLARRLKLKLSSHKQIRVPGLGGVPIYISTSARVKLTLGPRVVYILELWVANIGEGVDVLLGMDFMFSAGVRLGIREGLIKLPDDETRLHRTMRYTRLESLHLNFLFSVRTITLATMIFFGPLSLELLENRLHRGPREKVKLL